MLDRIPRLDRRAVVGGALATALPVAHSLGQPAGGKPADGAEPKIVLRVVASKAKLTPDAAAEADTWVLEGAAPGSVLRVRHGDEVSVRLVNGTTVPMTLHWHGVRVPNGQDGVAPLTQSPVAPGGSFDYRFTPPDSGTFLVRPMAVGGTSEPAGRGVAGMLVVEERDPPPVDGEHALLVRDWRTEPSGSLAPFGDTLEAALAGRLGNLVSVGGAPAPKRIEAAPSARLRLRLANGANARIMRIRFDDLKVVVAAVDGQPTDIFEPLRSTLPFPPGTRYDLLVDVPREAGGTGRITAVLGDGLTLVEVVASKATPVERDAPKPLPPNRFLPPEIKLQNALRREMPITGGATRGPEGRPAYSGDPRAIWALAGKSGEAGMPPLLTAKRGQPVVLGFHNDTAFPQPIHIHGHVFRLLHNLDDGWEPYWLDTFQVPEGKTAHIAFIADNPGRWLVASTVLERLDTGLWTWFEVT